MAHCAIYFEEMFDRVALDVPLPKMFDYRAEDATRADIGCRVLVPFGKKRLVGLIVELATESEVPASRLRAAERILRRSEEHTSELQSRLHLVCRLLLEKKKKTMTQQ